MEEYNKIVLWKLSDKEQEYYNRYLKLKEDAKEGKIENLACMTDKVAVRFMSEWDRIRFKLNKKLKG